MNPYIGAPQNPLYFSLFSPYFPFYKCFVVSLFVLYAVMYLSCA